MPLNACFGCHCELNGSLLDVQKCLLRSVEFGSPACKGPLFTASLPRGLQLSAGHYSKCVIIHLDHKLAITLAYVVIIWREQCYEGKKAICVKVKHYTALYNNKTIITYISLVSILRLEWTQPGSRYTAVRPPRVSPRLRLYCTSH